jgi:hypothetical protein
LQLIHDAQCRRLHRFDCTPRGAHGVVGVTLQ